MNLTFTKKLILDSVESDDGIQTIQFASYLKEEYIERLIKLSIKDNIVISIYFSSNDYGTAAWAIEKGFIDSHRWENEDDLKDISYLAKHYPSLLEDGVVPTDYALEKIVPDVLWNMIDMDLSFDIFRIIKSPADNIILHWNDIIDKNKKLGDDFINELIKKYENDIKELETAGKEHTDIISGEIKNNDNKTVLSLTKNIKIILQHAASAFKKIIVPINKKNKSGEDAEEDTISGNPKDAEGIKEYLERAKKLSRKIKRF